MQKITSKVIFTEITGKLIDLELDLIVTKTMLAIGERTLKTTFEDYKKLEKILENCDELLDELNHQAEEIKDIVERFEENN